MTVGALPLPVGHETRPPDESTTGKHILALDGFRGLALVLVFTLHFFWGNFYSGKNPLIWLGATIRNMGWVGVDLFFVLSGFLITGILYDTLGSPHYFRNFYARRALRILPVYFGYIGLMMAINHALGGYFTWGFLLEHLTFVGNLHISCAAPTVLPGITFNHLWSLAIEEQFYLVWPLLVILLRTRRRIALAAGTGVLLSLAIRLFFSANGAAARDPYILYSFTPCRLDGLCLGAALAMGVRSRFRHVILRGGAPAFLAGCLALCVMCWFYPYLQPTVYRPAAVWGVLLLAVTFAALLAWTLRQGSMAASILETPVLRFFGRHSYGLYVLHYCIADVASMARPSVRLHTHSKMLGFLLPSVGGMTVSILLAVLSFRFYELPLLRLKRYFLAETSKPKLEEALAGSRGEHSLGSGLPTGGGAVALPE